MYENSGNCRNLKYVCWSYSEQRMQNLVFSNNIISTANGFTKGRCSYNSSEITRTIFNKALYH